MDPVTMAAIASIIASTVSAGSSLMSGDGMNKVPTMTKGQKAVHGQDIQQLLQMGGNGGGMQSTMQMLQDYMNPESDLYQNFEAPYKRQFEEETLPGIAERYAGANAMGSGLSSSGFGQALGAAGGKLQTDLAAMKSTMQRNAITDWLNQYNQTANRAQNAQPFGYQQQGAGFSGGAAQGMANVNPGVWAQMMQYNQNPAAPPKSPQFQSTLPTASRGGY